MAIQNKWLALECKDAWNDHQRWDLVCPMCGFEYTHHGHVEVFERVRDGEFIEEGGQSIVLRPGIEGFTTTNSNPSDRRNAVRIWFSCENGHSFAMDVIQSKGHTSIELWGELDLANMPYAEYLKTDHWQVVRGAALERAGHACQLCNATDDLHVHHRTYERRGQELPSDVIVLCKRCHEQFHQVTNGRPTRTVR